MFKQTNMLKHRLPYNKIKFYGKSYHIINKLSINIVTELIYDRF